MELKGWGKFREKIPAFSGNWIFILLLYFLSVLATGLTVLMAFDSLPAIGFFYAINPSILYLSPLVGEIVIGAIGFFLVFQMWGQRADLKAKYGALSYQRIFLVGFTGILLVITLSANMFIPFWSFAPSFWAGSFLASPLGANSGFFAPAVFWVRVALAAFFSLLGVAMMVRSLLTFGLDYMTVIYLYFPEESRMQKSKIYSVLRHPTYSGVLFLALGGLFFTFSPYSFVFYLLYLCGFYAHVHFVEEKELIERFGVSYTKYKEDVPAFFISPKNAGILLDYLLGGG